MKEKKFTSNEFGIKTLTTNNKNNTTNRSTIQGNVHFSLFNPNKKIFFFGKQIGPL